MTTTRTRTLYVRDGDQPIWDAAERVARRRGISLSRLVIDALEDFLPRAAAEPPPSDRWAALAADDPAA